MMNMVKRIPELEMIPLTPHIKSENNPFNNISLTIFWTHLDPLYCIYFILWHLFDILDAVDTFDNSRVLISGVPI